MYAQANLTGGLILLIVHSHRAYKSLRMTITGKLLTFQVVEVWDTEVKLEFAGNFNTKFIDKMKFNVRFTFNRYRVQILFFIYYTAYMQTFLLKFS